MVKKICFYVLMMLIVLQSVSCNIEKATNKRTKVSLRNVGHQLLLSNNDTTSLVQPIQEINDVTYVIGFQNSLAIHPDTLVAIVNKSLKKSDIKIDYLLEVENCKSNEIVYSYEMKALEEKAIIPCRGRLLPINCYLIKIEFVKKEKSSSLKFLWAFVLGVIILAGGFRLKKKTIPTDENQQRAAKTIGSFKFYPEQSKLIKEAIEIPLSKKECELLAIFIAKPNQIIKREELMKKVWEDNGVVVGRSLDTYISKLRKKLKDDTSIKITNIHGVGYKLEID